MRLFDFTLPFSTSAGLVVALMAAPSAHAGTCTSMHDDNSCITYIENVGPSQTKVTYSFDDWLLGNNNFFQFESSSAKITDFTIIDGRSSETRREIKTIIWTPVLTHFDNKFVSPVFKVPTAPIGHHATISFEIPHDTFAEGEVYTFSLTTSENGSTMNSVLVDLETNGFFTSTRITTRNTPVPGPLPILGAGITFGYARFLRRRMRSNRIVPGLC